VTVETEVLPPRYQGAQRVGRGAMGEIYRATDATLGRPVAVKVLAEQHAADLAIRSRFMREARAAARLSAAPGVVTIFDVGEWNGRPFIVMEYLGGGSLAERINWEGAQPPVRALAWLEQAAYALDAAHREGVVHRDVKPANLLLDPAGVVHVVDFGIASAAGMDSLTQTGTVLGTAGYLSPEQARGERATAASDRYALAVVAWELLTGSRPFEAHSVTAEAAAHAEDPIPSISAGRPALPRELDAVFEQALAKEPERRFRSCSELVATLEAAFESASLTTTVVRDPDPWTLPAVRPTPSSPPRASLPSRRRRASWFRWLVGLAALAAVGGGIAGAVLGRSGASSSSTSSATVRTQPATTRPAASPTPATRPVHVNGGSHELNDRGYTLMRAGNYSAALPYLQRAAQALKGTGPTDPYEGYANYNLGFTLVRLGRCVEAVAPLELAATLEPDRPEPPAVLRQAVRCS
jgi:eukaryotic-like serine/threonine-protein kinase